jgi:hypothetical protein
VPRDDEEIRERRRVEAERAKTPEYWSYSIGVLRPLMFLGVSTLVGVVLLIGGPSAERRVVGLGLTTLGIALAGPAHRWHQMRRGELLDPPSFRNEFPLRRVELIAIAFMFLCLGLVSLGAEGMNVLGALVVLSAVAVAVYAWRS